MTLPYIMTTLVPLLLGCSGFALGLPGSLGVAELVALRDVHVCWDRLLLIVGFVCYCRLQLADGFGPSAFIGVCCFCISLSNVGAGVLWWYALVDEGVLALLVFQSLVYSGCTWGFVGGGWSLWTHMFTMVKMMAKCSTLKLFSKFPIWKVKSHAKTEDNWQIFQILQLFTQKDTALLLGLLIFLSVCSDHNLDY